MNRRLIVALAATILTKATITAQSAGQLSHNPKAVFENERTGALVGFVQNYLQYETEGGRLSDAGWVAAAPFFVHPIPPPKERNVIVFGYYGVGGGKGPAIKWSKHPNLGYRATAQVTVSTNEAVGRIDSSLRFFRDSAYGFDVTYDLVLTNGHPKWKLTNEGSAVFVGIPTAILYVSLMREKTTDPIIQKNADATLAALKKIPAY